MPEDLRGAYKKHKYDTEIIAAWLAESSISCGYQQERPETSSSDSTQREDAKEIQGNYQVKLRNFTRMAKVIAAYVPKVSIPEHIDETFHEVIMSRKRCTEWFETHSEGGAIEDERHRHFTTVLEGTLAILHSNGMTTSQRWRISPQQDSSLGQYFQGKKDSRTQPNKRNTGGPGDVSWRSQSTSIPSSHKMQRNWRTTATASCQPTSRAMQVKSWRSTNKA